MILYVLSKKKVKEDITKSLFSFITNTYVIRDVVFPQDQGGQKILHFKLNTRFIL